jgi:hypothetical protein
MGDLLVTRIQLKSVAAFAMVTTLAIKTQIVSVS